MIDLELEKVLQQKNLNKQIILVDDCSTDGTIDLVKKNYGSRIKILSANETIGMDLQFQEI